MSFDLFDNFATDEKLEIEGVWLDLTPDGKSRVRISRDDNSRYTNKLQQLIEENSQQLEDERKKLEAKEIENTTVFRGILRQAAAYGLVRDWEGVTYRGKALKWSVENAEMVLQHKDFLEFVLSNSRNMSHFKLSRDEEQVKN